MIYQKRMTILTATATLTYSQIGDIIVNASGAVTLTLPTPSLNLWYSVGNVGSGITTVSYESTALTTLKTGEQALFVCNGTSGWWMTRGGSTYELTKEAVEGVLTGEISTHSHAPIYEIPVGGTIGQVLVKATESDRTLAWGDPPSATNGIPTGGTLGQILAKKSATDFDVQWLDVPSAANGLPAGGAVGQILSKKSLTDFDAQWLDTPAAANGVPVGGTIGQILSKKSLTDYDAQWLDAPSVANGIPTGGAIGQVLKKNSINDYDAVWADETGSSPTVEESVWGGL